MAPYVFTDELSWSGVDLFLRVHLTLLHSLPFVYTLINVGLTDMTFLRKDWKLIMYTGLSYIMANCLGSFSLGHNLYPYTDWESPGITISIFLI